VTRRGILATVAAALAAALFPGAALAGEGSPPRLASVEVVAYEQAMDAARRPIGPKLRVSAGDRPDAAAPRVSSQKPESGSVPAKARTSRTLLGSGCKTVWVSRIGKSILGFTIWKYTQEKYFCWSSPRVTSVQTNAYPCCTDPTWHWIGQIGSATWFFSWAGDSKGGHYTFRQGRFEQTFAGKRLDSAQPWTKIWVYGDGSWAYSSGS
jgi:hypothetical protein